MMKVANCRSIAALLAMASIVAIPCNAEADDTLTTAGYFALRDEWRGANLYKQKKICERTIGRDVSMRGRVLVVDDEATVILDLDESLSMPDVMFRPLLKAQVENVQPGNWIRFSGTVSDCVGRFMSLHLTVSQGFIK